MATKQFTIIPIDPRTGKPRKGKWVNRCWIPDNPEPQKLMPQSNPSFEANSVCMWGRRKEKT